VAKVWLATVILHTFSKKIFSVETAVFILYHLGNQRLTGTRSFSLKTLERIRNVEVEGSIPFRSTIRRSVSRNALLDTSAAYS